MKKYEYMTVDLSAELTYTMQGDYNLPDLTMPQQPEVTLGRYAQMRRKFLKEHHKIRYRVGV